jgi:hypothetical protein
MEVVKRAWNSPLRNASPFAHLDWLLQNTTRVLKSWSDRSIGSIRLQLEVAKEVVHRLEITRDWQDLSVHEKELRKLAYFRLLGLSSLQHTIAR